MLIPLSQIRLDGNTQARVSMCARTVSEYADAMRNKFIFPPLDVFFDGVIYWLADGFHRYRAAQALGYENIDCTAHQGTQYDAFVYALGANAVHGLRRNNNDKRKAVTLALTHQHLKSLSDNKIAEMCKVTQPFVSNMRRYLQNPVTQEIARGKAKPKTDYVVTDVDVSISIFQDLQDNYNNLVIELSKQNLKLEHQIKLNKALISTAKDEEIENILMRAEDAENSCKDMEEELRLTKNNLKFYKDIIGHIQIILDMENSHPKSMIDVIRKLKRNR